MLFVKRVVLIVLSFHVVYLSAFYFLSTNTEVGIFRRLHLLGESESWQSAPFVKLVGSDSLNGDFELNFPRSTPVDHGPVATLSPNTTVFMDGVLGGYEVTVVAKEGPGENGEAYKMAEGYPEKLKTELLRRYGFNIAASNNISLDRQLKDFRNPECRFYHYPENLPTASIVLIFYNEATSTLLRNIHAIMNRTPAHLLAEIVLVDDGSTYDSLKGELDMTVTRFKGKVAIVRNKHQTGLIRARVIGAQRATGKVVVFLDAHCEVTTNWLPPLLAVIVENRKSLVAPFVDAINAMTFQYVTIFSTLRRTQGTFDWNMNYKEIPISKYEESKHERVSEPYDSPTMAGGLFAIERDFFFELGGYDMGLEVWGAEQYEISFKVWMCGGRLLIVPCSRVGHIYRIPNTGNKPFPFKDSGVEGASVVDVNHLRVMNVWLDDHVQYYYNSHPNLRNVSYGDVEKLKEFRRNNCPHNFEWFIEHVLYNSLTYFKPAPGNVVWGSFENVGSGKCLAFSSNTYGARMQTYGCHYSGVQLFRLDVDGLLLWNEHCVMAQSDGHITGEYCHYNTDKLSHWTLNSSKQLFWKTTRLCLESNDEQVILKNCTDNATQKWKVVVRTHN